MKGITMMGNTNAGKTCYLYVMAHQMSQQWRKFRFVPQNHKQAIKFKREWLSMQPSYASDNSTIVRKGLWPEGTTESETIQFNFVYGTKTLETFSWFDYRGGILTLANGEADEEEHERFHALAQNSACLIFCIPADQLQKSFMGIVDKDLLNDWNIFTDELTRFRKETGRKIPIVIAIMKADLLKKGEFEKAIDFLTRKDASKDDGSGPFDALINEDGWKVMFVGISLGEFGENQDEVDCETGRKFVTGTWEPCNVELPVYFAIRLQMLSRLSENAERADSLRSDRDSSRNALDKENNRTWLGKKLHKDDREALERDIDEKKDALNLVDAERDSLLADLTNIQEELRKAEEVGAIQVFENGRRLHFQ